MMESVSLVYGPLFSAAVDELVDKVIIIIQFILSRLNSISHSIGGSDIIVYPYSQHSFSQK